uniref:Uncharacterized protein n=1 Tax=Setaria digitata TaxID=48799 RepID=A0A915PPK4_9BILA
MNRSERGVRVLPAPIGTSRTRSARLQYSSGKSPTSLPQSISTAESEEKEVPSAEEVSPAWETA